ncbi:MAG: hypothetical protein IJJ41_01490 [Clostridia bacterium]|nr:hypothetical protein [Clostridia bacterium]
MGAEKIARLEKNHMELLNKVEKQKKAVLKAKLEASNPTDIKAQRKLEREERKLQRMSKDRFEAYDKYFKQSMLEKK